MGGTATTILQGLSTNLATIPGLRVADHIPEGVQPPMAVIQIQSVTYHQAMQGGLSEWQYVVSMVSGRMGDRSSQLNLDAWMDYGGAQSVRAAIESDPTLGGAAQSLIVNDMVSIRPLSIGDAAYLLAEFNVAVYA